MLNTNVRYSNGSRSRCKYVHYMYDFRSCGSFPETLKIGPSKTTSQLSTFENFTPIITYHILCTQLNAQFWSTCQSMSYTLLVLLLYVINISISSINCRRVASDERRVINSSTTARKLRRHDVNKPVLLRQYKPQDWQLLWQYKPQELASFTHLNTTHYIVQSVGRTWDKLR